MTIEARFPRRETLRDGRFWLLCAIVLLLAASFGLPSFRSKANGVDLLVVVDITGSMNTRDYSESGHPVSRLEHVKASLRAILPDLPCPARVGLAIFTERQPFLLFEPIDVCGAFAPVDGAIAGLDWRMAWEGDSHIASGLYRAIDMAHEVNADLVFFTDGQEAPPLPASGGPEFTGERGAVKGLIVGTGGFALSPIPKFDAEGREIGFYGVNDVPHENRFGPPPADAEQREGYNPRNAPFGSAAAAGTEHLSSVREPYLKALGDKTGLGFIRLEDPPALLKAILAEARPHPVERERPLRPFALGLALILLVALYGVPPLWNRLKQLRADRFSTLAIWRKSRA
ncbi:vWA domain-containing protein [Methylocella silvestris]|uniref:VWFA domain-containing protein n=1 Tax=Methylocella silvestris TaxID=199596 RepID=A0A2J7TEU2_METSI|nr:vWA domain-containing protein [Methylocella silvestris]PNG25285.1 hypothetical protein CR492_14125 [Methylocella silvestris]